MRNNQDLEHNYQNLEATSSNSSLSGSASPGQIVGVPLPNYSATVPIRPPMGTNRGPPPSYEEANDPNAPPPSYDSLFGRMREVHKSSNGLLDFLKKLFVILVGTIGCTIVIAVTIVIPIAMVVIGGIFFEECPVEHYIPIYLIIGGAVGIFKQALSIQSRVNPDQDEETESTLKRTLQSLTTCFLLGWFITGCFWVYGVYEPNYEDPNSPQYCDKTLYLFAFWLLTATYITLGLLTACLCCVSAAAVLAVRS